LRLDQSDPHGSLVERTSGSARRCGVLCIAAVRIGNGPGAGWSLYAGGWTQRGERRLSGSFQPLPGTDATLRCTSAEIRRGWRELAAAAHTLQNEDARSAHAVYQLSALERACYEDHHRGGAQDCQLRRDQR